MININTMRKIGMVYFIFGIATIMSSKITGNSTWLGILLFFDGLFLYFLPNKPEIEYAK